MERAAYFRDLLTNFGLELIFGALRKLSDKTAANSQDHWGSLEVLHFFIYKSPLVSLTSRFQYVGCTQTTPPARRRNEEPNEKQ